MNNPIDILKASNGKFVSVTYTNKKGETKSYTVRTGVTKYLVGGSKPYVPNSLTVYSVTSHNKGYKTFVKDGIKKIHSKALHYSVTEQ